jgi:hypothetical protein
MKSNNDFMNQIDAMVNDGLKGIAKGMSEVDKTAALLNNMPIPDNNVTKKAFNIIKKSKFVIADGLDKMDTSSVEKLQNEIKPIIKEMSSDG